MVSRARGRAFAACLFALAFACGGQSRTERLNGDDRGGSSGETGGSSFGGSSTGGSAGSSAGSAGESGIPPLACDEGDLVRIAPEDVAVRLARLFFETEAPDDVVARAREDGLATTGAVGCFARELLGDSRSELGIRNFFAGWLDLGAHSTPSQDPAYVPEFTPELFVRAREASVWYAWLMVESGSTFTRLLTDPSVPSDSVLAPFYDLTEPLGSGFSLSIPPHERSGILTQLYYSMSRASRAHGSPTQRGLGVAMMLGCTDFGNVPVDPVDDVPAEFESTTRAWYESRVSSEPTCQACHSLLTTAGYAFEHFDVLGRYRDEEAGLPVDASAELNAIEGGAVTGHVQAGQVLAENAFARRCFAHHWVAYAVSSLHGERAYAVPSDGFDDPAADRVVARASHTPGFSLREMFVAGVETAAFLTPLRGSGGR